MSDLDMYPYMYYVCASFSLFHPLISIPLALSQFSSVFPFVFKVHFNLTLTFFHTLEKRWASYTLQCIGAASFNNHTHRQTNFCMCMWVLNRTHLFWQDSRFQLVHEMEPYLPIYIKDTYKQQRWARNGASIRSWTKYHCINRML